MSNSVKIAAAVGVLFLAGVVYYLRAGNVNDLTSRTDYNSRLKCQGCGHEYDAKLHVADRPPFVCPSCGEKKAWFVWECGKCNTRFLPEPEGDPPRQPIAPHCPKCDSQLTGPASAGE